MRRSRRVSPDLAAKGKLAQARTAQEFLPFEDVRDNLIIINPWQFRACVQVQPVNLFLRSTSDRVAMEAGFREVIDSLQGRMQLSVISERMDPHTYLDGLRRQSKNLPPALQQYGSVFCDWVQSWIVGQDLLAKGCYIILCYDHPHRTDPPEAVWCEGSEKLTTTIQVLLEQLEGAGLTAKLLSTSGIIRLMDAVLSRDIARGGSAAQAAGAGVYNLFVRGTNVDGLGLMEGDIEDSVQEKKEDVGAGTRIR